MFSFDKIMHEAERQAVLLHKHAPKLKQLYVGEKHGDMFSRHLVEEHELLHFSKQ